MLVVTSLFDRSFIILVNNGNEKKKSQKGQLGSIGLLLSNIDDKVVQLYQKTHPQTHTSTPKHTQERTHKQTHTHRITFE